MWTRTFGGSKTDPAYSVQQTIDGGYIVAGYTCSYGVGSSNVFLIKTDANGDSLWTRTYGNTTSNYGRSVQQTTDDGYIIAGYTYLSGSSYCDAYLIKTDSIGDTLWTKTYGGPYGDRAYFVQQTTDDGYIFVGESWSYSITNDDIYLVKTDSIGDTLWTQIYEYGSGGADGYCVDQLEDGGYIVTGYVTTSNYEEICVLRTDSLGNTIWTKTYGDTWIDIGHSIQQTSDGGFIVAGQICVVDSSYNTEICLIKLASETGIEIGGDLAQLSITSMSPNPFSSTVSISYTLPEQDMAEIAVYDLSGRLVETIQSTTVSEGAHSLNWTPQVSLPSGCYLVVLDACGCRIAARCLKLD